MVGLYLFLLLFISLTVESVAAQWQWSVDVEGMVSSETKNHPTAFLWIPENCSQVRGIVVGMHNMQEEGIMEHPVFRGTMTEIGFAQIWVTPGLDPLFDPEKNSTELFEQMLNGLAEVSGYSEIKYAPIVPIGHSAYASYPWNFGAWNPHRTLAIVSVHGDAPQTHLTGCSRPNLNWQDRNTNGIPGVMVMGEGEWWEERLTPAIIYKNRYPNAPVSLLADAGNGHFDHSDMLVEYLALFIKKASQYRLPRVMSLTKQPKLKAVSPTKGWLADRWHKDSLPSAQASSYKNYRGDVATAFWYFDKEMAEKTEEYYATARGKKEQYISFRHNGKLVPFDSKLNAHRLKNLKLEDDGLSFVLSAVFTDPLREKCSTNHSPTNDINISRICGPVEKVNDTTFTIRFYRMGFDNPKRTSSIWLMAHHDGDSIYKNCVQQVSIDFPYPHTEGRTQKITFNALPNVEQGIKTITLNATSDGGLPVYYYVKQGPVSVNGSELTFHPIPPRAKFPIKVTVVAWQYGRNSGEKISTAQPIEQTFWISKTKNL